MTLKKVLCSLIILIFIGKKLNSIPGNITVQEKALIEQALGTAQKKTLIFAGLKNLPLLKKNLEIHAQNIGFPLRFKKFKKLSNLNDGLIQLNRAILSKFWELDPKRAYFPVEFAGSVVKKTYFDVPNSRILDCSWKLDQINDSFGLNPPTNLIAANIIWHELLYLFWDCVRLHQKYLKTTYSSDSRAKIVWFARYFPGFDPSLIDDPDHISGLASTIKTRHRKLGKYFLMSGWQVGEFVKAINSLLETPPLITPSKPSKAPIFAQLPNPKTQQKSSYKKAMPDEDQEEGYFSWFFGARKAKQPAQKPVLVKHPQIIPTHQEDKKVQISQWFSDHKAIFGEFKTLHDELKICSLNLYAPHAFHSDLETILYANNDPSLDPRKDLCKKVFSGLVKEKNKQTKIFLDSIIRQAPDLVVCQELQAGMEKYFTPQGYQLIQFIFSSKPDIKTNTPGHSLAIYSRIGSDIEIEILNASSKGQALPRHQICIVKRNGAPICLLFNVHLAMLEIDQLISDAKHYQSPTLPQIAIGDCNLDSGQSAQRPHIDTINRLKKEMNWSMEQHGSGDTSCVSQAGKEELLDHIFHSKNVVLTHFSMIGDPSSFWSQVYSVLKEELGQGFWIRWPRSTQERQLLDQFLPPYSRFKEKEKVCCSFQNPKGGCPNQSRLIPSKMKIAPFNTAQKCQRLLKSGQKFVPGGYHLKISNYPELICDRAWCKFGHRGQAHLERLRAKTANAWYNPPVMRTGRTAAKARRQAKPRLEASVPAY